MNSHNTLSLEVREQLPVANTQTLATEHPAAVEQERLPGENTETPSENRPSLLESVYYWLLSRS